jgi:hypothetical protein
VGVHEGAKKVLAPADHPRLADDGDTNRPHAGVSRRAVRVYVVLGAETNDGVLDRC